MNAHELLVENTSYIAPLKAIEGLTAGQAERRVEGAPHSIAEIVAHVAYWQDWFAARAEGTGTPMPEHAEPGWPQVPPGTWDEVAARYRAGLERAERLGGLDPAQPIHPPLEYPPEARYTVGDAMTHIALHTAHHLGQVVLLRQIQGLWPPPAGSWTW